MSDAATRAQRVMDRCDLLNTFSEEPGRLTRRFGAPELERAMVATAGWMTAAGMTTRRDPLGNLFGRYEGATPGASAFLLGSHLDSVRDAGKYDGPLGVLVALAAVEALHQRGARLPHAIEVAAFADEEGLRFRTAFLGSSAAAGTLDPAWLAAADDDGVPLAEAIRAFGGDPTAVAAGTRSLADAAGWLEVHIEQGPALEALDLPVGVVSAIVGMNKLALDFRGEAGHAGTVAMDRRRDALCAAAEFVLAAEAEARGTPGLVATVGQIAAEPGASNVVPGGATLSLDLRHPDDDVRHGARARLDAAAHQIAERRGVALTWHQLTDTGATRCDPALSARLSAAIAAAGFAVHHLPSGAGHDAVALASQMPVAMLFVRCAGGISHNPAEAVAVADVAAAITVVDRFLDASITERSGNVRPAVASRERG